MAPRAAATERLGGDTAAQGKHKNAANIVQTCDAMQLNTALLLWLEREDSCAG